MTRREDGMTRREEGMTRREEGMTGREEGASFGLRFRMTGRAVVHLSGFDLFNDKIGIISVATLLSARVLYRCHSGTTPGSP